MSIHKSLQENVLDASAERIDWTLNNFSWSAFPFPVERFYRDAASRCPESTAIKAKIDVIFLDWEAQFSQPFSMLTR